jgi:hypothetical protein
MCMIKILIWPNKNLNNYRNNGFAAIQGTIDLQFDVNKWNNMLYV